MSGFSGEASSSASKTLTGRRFEESQRRSQLASRPGLRAVVSRLVVPGWPADRAEQNGVRLARRRDLLVPQRDAVRVDPGPADLALAYSIPNPAWPATRSSVLTASPILPDQRRHPAAAAPDRLSRSCARGRLLTLLYPRRHGLHQPAGVDDLLHVSAHAVWPCRCCRSAC